MNKIVAITLSTVVVVTGAPQLATGAASHPKSSISVFTYLVGGPLGKSTQRKPVSNVAVRVRRLAGGKLVREVKFLKNGHVVFRVNPGSYRVEGAIESPNSAVVRRSCGSKIVRVHKGRQASVRLYCSVP